MPNTSSVWEDKHKTDKLFTKGKDYSRWPAEARTAACLYLPYLLPVCLPLCANHNSTPPRLSTMYSSEEEQPLLLIRSLSLDPCFNTAEVEFPRRTWLIRGSTNTANYSLMRLSESQFSHRRSPMPQNTGARRCSHHCRLNKDKWGLSKLLSINKSLSSALCLSAHITLALIRVAFGTLIVMTWQWSGLWNSKKKTSTAHWWDVGCISMFLWCCFVWPDSAEEKVSRSC